jgi:ribonuclease HI
MKYYVVWAGKKPGVYDNWADCSENITGTKSAKYKSFKTQDEAFQAFADGWEKHLGKATAAAPAKSSASSQKPNLVSLSVDAACSGNPGLMEYRGVDSATKQEIFRMGPLEEGTNNIGEFLAIVHGLAHLKQKNSSLPIYTDSVTALAWVRDKKCKTKIERTSKNDKIFQLIERAEKWLHANTWSTQLYKWDTENWGEIPADFGRK